MKKNWMKQNKRCVLLAAALMASLLLTACGGRQAVTEPDGENAVCTVSVSCEALLDRLDELDEGTAALVPEDGWLLASTEVAFAEGESAFDVLQRTCRELKIHLEFSEAPLYDSVYIEGIGNLYEAACGEMSGWLYQVNGQVPNCGCNQYQLQNGDAVTWTYSCDMLADLAE